MFFWKTRAKGAGGRESWRPAGALWFSAAENKEERKRRKKGGEEEVWGLLLQWSSNVKLWLLPAVVVSKEEEGRVSFLPNVVISPAVVQDVLGDRCVCSVVQLSVYLTTLTIAIQKTQEVALGKSLLVCRELLPLRTLWFHVFICNRSVFDPSVLGDLKHKKRARTNVEHSEFSTGLQTSRSKLWPSQLRLKGWFAAKDA